MARETAPTSWALGPMARETGPGNGLPEVKKIDFSKFLGMASPGVEYVPTSLETIFKLSRGPQRPYTKKSGNFENE